MYLFNNKFNIRPSSFSFSELAILSNQAVNTRRGLHTSRIYINRLIRKDNEIFTELNKKVDTSVLETTVSQLVNNELSSNIESIDIAVNSVLARLEARQQQLLQQINTSAYNAAILITNSNNAINTSVQSALISLVNGNSIINNSISNLSTGNNIFNQSVQSAIQQASNSIANQQQLSLEEIASTSNEIANANIVNIQNAAGQITFTISKDLLEKIDYLFYTFYRTDSLSIMTNYPLNPQN